MNKVEKIYLWGTIGLLIIVGLAAGWHYITSALVLKVALTLLEMIIPFWLGWIASRYKEHSSDS